MSKSGQFQYIDMPEVYSRRRLNALYRAIPLKDSIFRELRKYFNAMANLYGAISLRKAYQIISKQRPRLVSREEFLAFSEIARHECEEYYLLGDDELYTDGKLTDVMDRKIIDISLLDADLSRYQELLQAQEGKPFYIPPKPLFLAYEDPFYCEPSQELENMRLFLSEHLRLGAQRAESVLEELVYGIRCANAGLPQVLDRLSEMNIIFPKQHDLQKFIELYQAFHNNMRMQCNRGYTPEELYAMQMPEERIPQGLSFGPNIRKALVDGSIDAGEMRKTILSAGLPSEKLRFNLLRELDSIVDGSGPIKKVKIGRNDLCPCGSGKKYKKCCGR